MITTEVRVARGAALLDQDLPDWEKRVTLETLDIASRDACILAECYGGYHAGLKKLGVGVRSARSLGFNLYSPLDAQALRDAWRRFITARREAKP